MKIRTILLILLATLLFASCGSEYRLANRFIDQSQGIQVAVYFPEEAQVTLVQDEDGSYTNALDSVNQDLFLDIMYAAYADELGRYGLNVYIPEESDTIPMDARHWLVILSKVEIQGLYTDHVDQLFDFTDDYAYTFSLNTVNVASWFDINDGEWQPTLFDEYNLTDQFDSYVTRSRKDGVQYHYNITPMKTKDVYDFAVFLGKRYAAFTYDQMMNRYVATLMGTKGQTPRFKLRWDPYDKTFYFRINDEGFIEITPEPSI